MEDTNEREESTGLLEEVKERLKKITHAEGYTITTNYHDGSDEIGERYLNLKSGEKHFDINYNDSFMTIMGRTSDIEKTYIITSGGFFEGIELPNQKPRTRKLSTEEREYLLKELLTAEVDHETLLDDFSSFSNNMSQAEEITWSREKPPHTFPIPFPRA